MPRLFYGKGKGFQSRHGFVHPGIPRSMVTSIIRPPFATNGDQFVRNVGVASKNPMPFGDEGNVQYITETIVPVDTPAKGPEVQVRVETISPVDSSTPDSGSGTFDIVGKRGVITFRAGGRLELTSKRGVLSLVELINTSDSISLVGKHGGLSLIAGGRISLEAKKSTLSFSGSSYIANNIILSAKKGKLSITGIVGTIGPMSLNAKKAKITITGYSDTQGTFSLAGKKGNITITELIAIADHDTVVICTDNLANTEYANFGFNSFAETILGMIGANANGIYLLEGSDDDGTDIDATLETVQDDFGHTEEKEVPDVYVSYIGGPIHASIVNDETVRTPNNLENAANVKSRRFSPGSGINSTLWGIRIENLDGTDIKIRHIEFVPYLLSGKIS